MVNKKISKFTTAIDLIFTQEIMDMRKTTLKILLACLLLSNFMMLAQEKSNLNSSQKPKNENLVRCASDEYNAELLKNNPKMMGSKAYENLIKRQIEINKTSINRSQGAVVYTIPVVVHVLHNGEPIGVGPNISDAQVLSQIQVLNEDYRRMVGTRGFNTNPVGADVEIEFCLAKQTPDGCPTTGIDRVNIGQNGINETSLPNALTQMDALKPSSIWDASRYMNMWSVAFNGGSGILGYAQFPGGVANTDGVVSDYRYFGSNDDPNVTLTGTFNLGRTMTHEVGHYLGLFHTFQDGCSDGDFVADTPAVATPNYGCPAGTDSCVSAGLDMIENYMEYTDDSCMNVFTNDQKTRIIATMTGAANRPSSLTSNVCNALASVNDDGSINIEQFSLIECTVNFTPSLRITNWGTVTLTSATVAYDVDGGGSTNYNWTGSLNYGESEIINLPTLSSSSGNHVFNVLISNPNGNTDLRNCNDSVSLNFAIDPSYDSTSQINLTLTPDDFGSEITWEFRASSNALLYSGGPYTNGDTTVINQVFNVVPNECYAFTIFDSQGDGICCGFGNGSYELTTDNATVIVSGGAYGAGYGTSEVTNISTASTLGVNDYFVNNGVSLFPNPTSDIINIKLARGNDLPDSYKIYNILGQLVAVREISNQLQLKIDVSSLSKGVYFVKVIKEGASTSIPFIKN
ncbi:MAG: T9SS type A sorting domain-containing protein [Chlorobi bacterium]|nr:T9SS type A sorting domain-containing protein [Chlorobiota bacterium]